MLFLKGFQHFSYNYYTSEFIFFRQFVIRGVAIAYNAIAGLSFYSY
ncbi:MAG: hypothetical protein HEQ29_10760 [Dolichospermum sp. LBC05a]|nr:hypothetical protein [Dolichospermum sp. OL01]MCO5797228.1 hypothetical protein [Dolichospermum sp. OL03]MCS6280876.1 hypothetical protein [Dolichospermum sp.]QSV58764.1 MAG: hypothetical protein HEQ29_10760 [Dolichospermum sp. LBC05a]